LFNKFIILLILLFFFFSSSLFTKSNTPEYFRGDLQLIEKKVLKVIELAVKN
jgi:uncharacterized membrane protein